MEGRGSGAGLASVTFEDTKHCVSTDAEPVAPDWLAHSAPVLSPSHRARDDIRHTLPRPVLPPL